MKPLGISRLNPRGFSLIELLITTTVIMVVFLGFSRVLDLYVNHQQNLDYGVRKQDLLVTTINLINNDVAWQKTIDQTTNSNLDCLKDPAKFPSIPKAGNCTMADGGAFSLYDDAGTVYADTNTSTAGFSLHSGACNTYSSTGSDVCPLRAEVSWRPLCINCTRNQVEITINLYDTPLNRKTVQAKLITRKLVRYSQPYDSDLVLWMKLDGTIGTTASIGSTITDSSGNSNDGTIQEWASGGTLPTYSPGKSGQGLSFDSGFDKWKWVSIPDVPSLRPATITVAAWVNWTNANAVNWAGIVDKEYSGIYDSYVLRVHSDHSFAFCLAETVANQCVESNANPIAKNTWYHVAGTWDGTTIKIYVNGVLQTTTLAYSGPNNWTNSPILVGTENQAGSADSYNTTFPGIIDQVKIWKRALSPSEILREYNNP